MICSAAATAGLFLGSRSRGTAAPLPAIDRSTFASLAARVLEAARSAGASYADIRVNRYRNQYIGTREEQVQWVSDDESLGMGVRVLAGGAWGFASGTALTAEEAVRIAREAVAIAKATSALRRTPVELAPVQSYKDTWSTPAVIDPFSLSIEEKATTLIEANRAALGVEGTRFVNSTLFQTLEHKFFASTEGSEIEQTIHRIWPSLSVTAVNSDGTDFQSCSAAAQPMGAGYEYVRQLDLAERARHAAENAVAKLSAPSITPGVRDLVLMPSHLWLVIHESIGHATELDRALGYEANYAGTSFVTVDNLRRLRYGSDVVSVVGDRTETGGLSTVGYDDEGVKASRFDIIRDGLFVGYQTTREQAGWIGEHASHGCAYADSYSHVPMQRMPNVSLQPGAAALSPNDLVSGIDDGVLIEGDGSWSIDQQRRNFQFGGQVFHRIKGGKIDGVYRDVAFQSMTLDFWRSCDAVCSKEHYALGGSYWCGKAQPGQVAPVSHGSAPARFRRVNFINTGRKV